MIARGPLKPARHAADSRGVRRLLATIGVSLTAFALVLSLAAPAVAADDSIDIEGGGWGHGIGLSQYGAYGQALEGRSADEIVGHYYTGAGTALLDDLVAPDHFVLADPNPLWVALLTNQVVFEFRALDGPLTVCHAGGGGCSFTARPGEVWRFVAADDGTCRFEVDGAPHSEPGQCRGSVRGIAPNIARIQIAGLPKTLDEFARGVVRIRTPNSGDSFHVSLEIGLEAYMYGLSEMPFSWHPEALRAQALAGRSYAVWRLIGRGPEPDFGEDRRATCWCHMFATTLDQSYRGWTNETTSNSAAWKSAVDDTQGRVVTHPDASQQNVVAAFYSSSTRGRTENAHDIWGGSSVSYLQSRPDPWSQDPAVNNPFASWTFPAAEADLAAALGVRKVDGAKIVSRFDSGTPSRIDFYTRGGGTKQTISKSGSQVHSLLGLRGRNISGFDYGAVTALGGDFTGDGRDDVTMAIPFNATWWVGRSTPGRFRMSPWLNHTSNNRLDGHVTGDFDGDGKTDVAAVQEGSGKLLVGLSKGSRFSLRTWANHGNPDRWGPLLVGDFNGDGADDIAEYENRRERWRVYRLSGGELQRSFWYDFAVVDPVWGGHVAGDFNGDGKDDILSLDATTGDLIVLFSDGAALAPTAWQTLPHAGAWQDLQAADFTGNGRDDLAAYDPDTATWWIVAGRARQAGRAPQPWYSFPNAPQGAQIAGDFTGDGRADIAAYSRSTGGIEVLTSDGSGFAAASWGAVPARHRVAAVIAVDSNGDGIHDLAAWDNQRRRWWVGESTATSFDVSRWGTLLR